MTMNDLVKLCRCKYAKWKKSGESTTAWIWCKLQDEITDVNHCEKCTKRED